MLLLYFSSRQSWKQLRQLLFKTIKVVSILDIYHKLIWLTLLLEVESHVEKEGKCLWIKVCSKANVADSCHFTCLSFKACTTQMTSVTSCCRLHFRTGEDFHILRIKWWFAWSWKQKHPHPTKQFQLKMRYFRNFNMLSRWHTVHATRIKTIHVVLQLADDTVM